MSISKEDVIYVSKLANIELSGDKQDDIVSDMQGILSFIETINKLNTDNVKPLANVMDQVNIKRKDEPTPSLPVEKIEKNSPHFKNGHIVVPAVID